MPSPLGHLGESNDIVNMAA